MKTAFIFAAGRGERLRPFTDTKPKALCPINGTPLIEYHVRKLVQAGVTTLIINHAYLGGMIREYLGDGQRFGVTIIYAPEPPGALETGGALIFAQQLIGNNPFITVNADIFTDFDFSSLRFSTSQPAHLVLVDKPDYYHHADFGLSEAGLVLNDHKHYTFSGIACYHPSLFSGVKPGRFSLTPLIRQWASASKVSGEVYSGYWSDIGTPERLFNR